MAEEVRHPSVQVPQAIAYSIPIGTISGLLFLLPILFTLPDIQTLLAVSSPVPGGQPIGVMFTLIMGSRSGGFGMVSTLSPFKSGTSDHVSLPVVHHPFSFQSSESESFAPSPSVAPPPAGPGLSHETKPSPSTKSSRASQGIPQTPPQSPSTRTSSPPSFSSSSASSTSAPAPHSTPSSASQSSA
ncbi:hypothetical protein C0993_006943 [Termitomyces sp. T159_Od127]|nr:hypothetical protein C0993_006943 [Termitomyces sp. T159_Od127]